MIRHPPVFLLLLAGTLIPNHAFVPSTLSKISSFHQPQNYLHPKRYPTPRSNPFHSSNLFPSTNTPRNAINFPSFITNISSSSSTLRKKLHKLISLLLNTFRRILYPKSFPDPTFSEPLPPGSFGCPFFGSNFIRGSKDYGPGVFYHERASKLGYPNIWKFFFLGNPLVAISGANTVKTVLSKEFDTPGIKCMGANEIIVGKENILNESQKEKHSFLRRLVGGAMTPAAVAEGVPTLQQAATEQIDELLKYDSVKMETICTDYTLDVAWRQILGLDLKETEIPVFHTAVGEWIGGINNLRSLLKLPGLKSTKAYKAREYLISKIEEKIDQLERDGPDGSTLSGMVFATDDEDESSERRLTREQVIDNALILILAGSETSASTLTVAMLLLGLHPEVWNKLKEEQREIQLKHGDAITKDVLDKECPYLDVVIKETMRIKPIQGGAPRMIKNTLVVDGQQIPKGWGLVFNVRVTHEQDPKTRKEDGSHMDIRKGFMPERWLDAETKPTEFIPFGAGPRYCLGANLALTEMKVFLASLARRIDFDLVGSKENIEWKKQSIMPLPASGVVVSARAAN